MQSYLVSLIPEARTRLRDRGPWAIFLKGFHTFYEGKKFQTFLPAEAIFSGIFTAGGEIFRHLLPEAKIFRISMDFVNWGPLLAAGGPIIRGRPAPYGPW